MSENIFLSPVVYPEFERTVVNPINLAECIAQSEVLEKVQNPKNTRVWGIKESRLNRNFYNQMTEDDVVLFYNSEEYIYYARVKACFESQEVSRRYWGDIPAKLLYSVRDLTEIGLPKETLNDTFGYKQGYLPQSVRVVANKPMRKMKQEYGTLQGFLDELHQNFK